MNYKKVLLLFLCITILVLPSISLSQSSSGRKHKELLQKMAKSLDMDLKNLWLKELVTNPQKSREKMTSSLNYKFLKYFKGNSTEKLLSKDELNKHKFKNLPSKKEVKKMSEEIAEKMTP